MIYATKLGKIRQSRKANSTFFDAMPKNIRFCK